MTTIEQSFSKESSLLLPSPVKVPQTTQQMPAPCLEKVSTANQQSETFRGASQTEKRMQLKEREENNSSTMTIHVGFYLFIFCRNFSQTHFHGNTFPWETVAYKHTACPMHNSLDSLICECASDTVPQTDLTSLFTVITGSQQV